MTSVRPEKKRSCLAALVLGVIRIVFTLLLFLFLVIGGINCSVILSSRSNILDAEEVKSLEDIDMIVVLGASVHGDEPSAVLKDRLDQAVELYKAGVADKILMTGDGQSKYYNEVRTMKKYVRKQGVPGSAVLKDAKGLCTYDSMTNLADQYGPCRVLVVTQRYHLYRAMYIGRKCGLTTYGCSADRQNYKDITSMNRREILARCKDYLMIWLEKFVED